MEDGNPVLPMLYNALALTPPPVFPSDIFLQFSSIVNVYSTRFPSDCIIKAIFPLCRTYKYSPGSQCGAEPFGYPNLSNICY